MPILIPNAELSSFIEKLNELLNAPETENEESQKKIGLGSFPTSALEKKLSEKDFAIHFFNLLARIPKNEIAEEAREKIFNCCKEKLRLHLDSYLSTYKDFPNMLRLRTNPKTMLGALIDHQTGFIKTKETTTRKRVTQLVQRQRNQENPSSNCYRLFHQARMASSAKEHNLGFR